MDQLKLMDLPGYDRIKVENRLSDLGRVSLWLPDDFGLEHIQTAVKLVNEVLAGEWVRRKKDRKEKLLKGSGHPKGSGA